MTQILAEAAKNALRGLANPDSAKPFAREDALSTSVNADPAQAAQLNTALESGIEHSTVTSQWTPTAIATCTSDLDTRNRQKAVESRYGVQSIRMATMQASTPKGFLFLMVRAAETAKSQAADRYYGRAL